MTYEALRQEIIDTCLAMNARGINQGMSGNASARIQDGFLITPSGVAYDAMQPEQIVQMDMEAGYEGAWRPSSEWRLHLAVYAARPDATAILHTHSNYATALSCLRQDIPAFHYMIAVTGGATLRCAEYVTLGTKALCDAMLAVLTDRTACLLANHGQICFGPSLEKALWLAGEIETLCKQYWIARQMGEPVILDDAEMDRVLALFTTYGKQGDAPPALAPPPQ